MITTELKDKVLGYLIENQVDLSIDFDGESLAPMLATSPSYIAAIIEDLSIRGMLAFTGYAGYLTSCWLKVKLFDFYRAGGYAFEDCIIDGNIMKLKMEIEAMEANIGKPQYDKMMAMVMAVIAGFSLVSGKNV